MRTTDTPHPVQIAPGLGPAHTTRIKDWPTDERPRERFRALGPGALRTAELLAILLSSGAGGRTALEVAETVYQSFGRSLRRLAAATSSQLRAIPGIGEARAVSIQAALELGRRGAQEVRMEDGRVSSPRDVYRRFELKLRDLRQEEFHILLLNSQNAVISDVMITRNARARSARSTWSFVSPIASKNLAGSTSAGFGAASAPWGSGTSRISVSRSDSIPAGPARRPGLSPSGETCRSYIFLYTGSRLAFRSRHTPNSLESRYSMDVASYGAGPSSAELPDLGVG